MSNFINMFGGNKDTMRHSGLTSLRRALDYGLTINQIRDQVAREGVSFGPRAQEYLDARSPNTFISQYGGNEDTMANSGMQSVSRAMAAGLTPAEIDERARQEGISFGTNARSFLDTQARQKAESEKMKSQFDSQMKALQSQMASQQKSYQDSLVQMTNTLNASMNPNTRQSVLGVQSAGSGKNSTRETLSRKGVKGSFNRAGLRIKGLNV